MFKLFRASAYHQVEEQLSRLAVGDFSMGKPNAESGGSLWTQLKRTTRSLKGLIRVADRSSRSLHQAMEQTSARSAAIAEQVDAVTVTIREITEGVQHSADYMQEMAEQMSRIHGHLDEVREQSGRIAGESSRFSKDMEGGRREMAEAMERMTALAGESRLLHSRMNQLDQALSHIVQMNRFIEDLSGQTGLLALNASIEAARAGEQGKGFAVVAEEIAMLAKQTKDATAQIGSQVAAVHTEAQALRGSVDQIQMTVKDGVQAMESAVSRYGGISRLLMETMSGLAEMDQRLNAITQSSLAISDAASHNSAMIQQVAAGSEEVLASVEVQSRGVSDMNDHIQQAQNSSMSLRSAISQFKLEQEDRSADPLHLILEQWSECALSVRAVMVSMIDCRNPEQLSYWNKQKNAQELRLHECFKELKKLAISGIHVQYCNQLWDAWHTFSRIKDQNARWMLEGEYDKAKQGLVVHGRETFKAAMDLAIEWLELENGSSNAF